MSFSIPQNFVEQFSSNVHMLTEQSMSRLRKTVTTISVTGESFAVERLGGSSINTVDERHGDTPLNDISHTRRWGYIQDYDTADLIDKVDRLKLLIDVDSKYTRRHASAMGRGFDDNIIATLGASATEGKSGGTLTALPSGQKVVSGSTGLTIDKLLSTKLILDQNEVDDIMPRYFVTSALGITNLLADDKISSQDYNVVQALVQGKVNHYLGFDFIRIERLLTNSSSERLNYGYVQEAVTLGIAQEPTSIGAERPDKRHSKQIYTYGSWGSVRVEDELVVQVAVAE